MVKTLINKFLWSGKFCHDPFQFHSRYQLHSEMRCEELGAVFASTVNVCYSCWGLKWSSRWDLWVWYEGQLSCMKYLSMKWGAKPNNSVKWGSKFWLCSKSIFYQINILPSKWAIIIERSQMATCRNARFAMIVLSTTNISFPKYS